MLNTNKLTKLIFWIVLFQLIGFLLGLLTQSNIHPWYTALHKSMLTPPGFVFSIVWTLLYAVLAVIAWLLSEDKQHTSTTVVFLFGLQMFMNWAWTLLFFKLHWLTLSMIWLITLSGLNLVLILKTRKTHQVIAWLLTPYLVWLIFASYLNVLITINN